MKKTGIIVVLLALAAGFTLGCGEDEACIADPVGFQGCHALCVPNEFECVANCVNNWYCADWGPYCAGGFADYWGYCY